MASVLMTGASGLIGTWVRRLWSNEEDELELKVTNRAHVDLLQGDAFARLVRLVSPTTVLHLAWSAGGAHDYRNSPDNDRWADVTIEAADLCRHLGVRFVALGTVLDDHPPADAYMRSKQAVRQSLESAIRTGDITWIRPFYVFDPIAGRPTVISMAHAARNAEQRPVLLHPYARHDFVHAADVARGVIAAVHHRLGGVVEIGAGRQHTVAELMAGAGLEWTTADHADEETHDHRTADISTLLSTGWRPTETEKYFSRH